MSAVSPAFDGHIARCKCGEVEIELTGAPFMAINCCCNDCVSSIHFIDEKAKANGFENISGVEVYALIPYPTFPHQ